MNDERRPKTPLSQPSVSLTVADDDGARILEEVVSFIRRYVVMTPPQATAAALWVVHSYALDACEASPLLAITSAEKRSGKTRLLDVLELLVANPWRVVMPSEAVLFRKLHTDRPTLLLDEADAIFNPKAGANAEGLRAILNAGNRPGTMVPRCVGPSQALISFKVFGAKALAGIRDLPDTIADRAIPIRLQRKAPKEVAERFRLRDASEAAEPIAASVASWVQCHAPHLAEARPVLPDALNDRAQDAWEPLLAIADRVGGDWPALSHRATLALSNNDAKADASAGVRLLADIRGIFDVHGVDKIGSAELAEELHELEESPSGEWYGRPITPRRIATLLSHYGIRPRTVRLDDGTTPKGYRRDQFEDAWSRYTPSENATTPQSAPVARLRPVLDRHEPLGVADEKPQDSVWIDECGAVADENAMDGRVKGFADADEAYDYYAGKVAAAEAAEARST